MTIHRVWPGPTGSGYTLRFGSRLIQSEYRRYAEVARKLANQQQGSNGFMWAQLAALWDKLVFFFPAEDGIRDYKVTGVQTCALPISGRQARPAPAAAGCPPPRARRHRLSR